MNLKKMLCLVLSVGFIVSSTVGCSSQSSSQTPASKPASDAAVSPDSSTDTAPENTGDALAKPENFPKKEITIIVPYGAGGAYDSMARLLQQVIKRDHNVDAIVKNVTGGSGAVGAVECLTSKPDGYTICMTSGTFISHIATGKVGSKLDDLVPICSVSEDPVVLVTKPGRYDSIEDFIKKMKESPDAVSIATPGLGNANNAFAQILCDNVGGGKVVNLEGGARIATELLGDHVDAGSVKPNDVMSQLLSGQLQAICTFSKERIPAFPDVPTAQEIGIDMYPYGDGCRLYVFMMAPKGVSPEIKTYLERLFVSATQSEDFQKMAMEAGFAANSYTGEKLKEDIQGLYDIAPILDKELFSKAGA